MKFRFIQGSKFNLLIQMALNKKLTRTRIVLILFGTLFLAAFASLIGLSTFFYDSYQYPDEFSIVVDAGSSGSRTYIYSWQGGLSAYKGDDIRVKELFNCKRTPGINALRTKEDVILYFNDCLQEASKFIPNQRKNRTHIILAATAGMRLLNITDKNQSDKILSYIRYHFSKSGFLYKSDDQVKIIDGKDEGLYAWISANYFSEKFSKDTDPITTWGTLDLGAYIIIQNDYTQQVNASCLYSKLALNVSTSTLLNSPCSNGDIFKFNPNIDLEKLKKKSYYIFDGESNPEKCQQELEFLFPEPACDFDKKCSFNNVYQPELISKNKFYAFSSYYYQMVNSEKLAGKILKNDFELYSSETKRLCSLDYNEITSINNKLKPMILDEYLRTTCFYNLYIMKLLSKFQITSFANVEIIDKINDYSIGWTLGYMIDLINRQDFLPEETPPRKIETKFYIPLLIHLAHQKILNRRILEEIT
ncbi:ectonucleoside triphosphate diphosphohydrolase 1 isoform X1 [Brachionus plicatilis]|uniref:Ectonucleoside triphosphate diphosphohydrolase 1 isoform X1 n=1 Tax=Brachionus plicatilis TaxID=10195 RepID=A0A3M7P791_BRAPC|nr:ectonucleoside triphosphate diphosphohydrolase 1 isoform X1 [Brachionus plicatilis]